MNGIANGDPSSHEFMKSDSVNAYLGLARAMISVNKDCTSPNRDLALSIDVDHGKGPAVIEPSVRFKHFTRYHK